MLAHARRSPARLMIKRAGRHLVSVFEELLEPLGHVSLADAVVFRREKILLERRGVVKALKRRLLGTALAPPQLALLSIGNQSVINQ